MTPKRQKAEDLVYKYMDAVDKTGSNTTYYKRLFSTMSDKQFEDFCKKDLPFRFHTRVFDINPTMTDIEKGLFITTGSFSKQAIEEASNPGKKQIDLINGEEFISKLAEYGIGVKEVKDYEIDEDYFKKI